MKTTIQRAAAVALSGAILAGAQIIAAPAAHAYTYWGAIAVADDGTTGRSYDYATQALAESAAISSCGYSDCEVLTSFSNGCGAVAYRSDRGWYGASGYTLATARSRAISYNGGGYIQTWVCTSGHG